MPDPRTPPPSDDERPRGGAMVHGGAVGRAMTRTKYRPGMRAPNEAGNQGDDAWRAEDPSSDATRAARALSSALSLRRTKTS